MSIKTAIMSSLLLNIEIVNNNSLIIKEGHLNEGGFLILKIAKNRTAVQKTACFKSILFIYL